jgi:small subunit ribosomal protein S6
MSKGRCTLRDYEAVFIFDSALEESAIGEKLDRYHGLANTAGGEVAEVDHWGKRQLAYQIRDKDNGYYVVSHFSAESSALPELERAMKLDEGLLRYLIVINEGELKTSPFSEKPAGEGGEGSDDDEE